VQFSRSARPRLLGLFAALLAVLATACAPPPPPAAAGSTAVPDAIRSLFAGTGPAAESTPSSWQDLDPTALPQIESVSKTTANSAIGDICAGRAGVNLEAFLADLMSGDVPRFRGAIEAIGGVVVDRLKRDGNLPSGSLLRIKYPAYMIALSGYAPITDAEAERLDSWLMRGSAAWELYKRLHPEASHPTPSAPNALCNDEVP
jgi:hypothetical protein